MYLPSNSGGCRKLKRGSIILSRRPYVLRVLLPSSKYRVLLLYSSIPGGAAMWQDEVRRRVLRVFKMTGGNRSEREVYPGETLHTHILTLSKVPPRLSQSPRCKALVLLYCCGTAAATVVVLCVPWLRGCF